MVTIMYNISMLKEKRTPVQDRVFKVSNIGDDLKYYSAVLDEVNLKLLNAIFEHGPRNMAEISRITGIPKSSVHTRIRKIARLFKPFTMVINAHRIGLGRMLAIVVPSSKNFRKTIKELIIPWCYELELVSHPSPGIIAEFYYPYPDHDLIMDYLEDLQREEKILQYKVYLLNEPFLNNRFNEEYVDPASGSVKLPWGTWLDKILSFGAKPITPKLELSDEDFTLPPDSLDLEILRILEENPQLEFLEMAKILGFNHQTIRYHYIRHVLGRNTIRGFGIKIPVFPPKILIRTMSIMEFKRDSDARMFFGGLWNTPIMEEICKAKNITKYVMRTSIPVSELGSFTLFLIASLEKGIISKIEFQFNGIQKIYEGFIPSKLFVSEKNKWSRRIP